MFRDVSPTSDITQFTMGGSALRLCVCWCVCDVCMGYSCGLELHIGFFREGGHLCKSLEVPFSLWRMFMCTLMCVCARV